MYMPKHPCIGCVYSTECGDTNRTTPCLGRMTISQQKRMLKEERLEKLKARNK